VAAEAARRSGVAAQAQMKNGASLNAEEAAKGVINTLGNNREESPGKWLRENRSEMSSAA